MAFVTFLIYDVMVILRVNLFLEDLTQRVDWQSMMGRYEANGTDSLREYVTLAYVKGTPLKVGVATCIGTGIGVVGSTLGILARRQSLTQTVVGL
jgi:hypothetical protein